MQVEVRIDPSVTEPKVIVMANELTEEVNALVQALSESEPKMIAGFREDTVTVLDDRISSGFTPRTARYTPCFPPVNTRFGFACTKLRSG